MQETGIHLSAEPDPKFDTKNTPPAERVVSVSGSLPKGGKRLKHCKGATEQPSVERSGTLGYPEGRIEP
jgi:hypothetical protein